MRRKLFFFSLFLLVLIGLARTQKTREAVFAGSFYDQRPGVLSQQIRGYLKQAMITGGATEGLSVLIVPHAGYACSGPVAAYGYSLVQGLDFETVVVIGPSHRAEIRGCSIFPEGGYKTPLGEAPVDRDLAQEIARISGFGYNAAAHQVEHSIEVQIPFLQTVLPRAKIVPILMGSPTKSTIFTLADSLVKALRGKNALVVASTDLSHYFSKEKANQIDAETSALLQNYDTQGLLQKLQRGENIMCGGGGVVSALLYAKDSGPAKVEILKYADSSSTCSSPTNVVGYLAAAVYHGGPGPEMSLSQEEKAELLKLARTSISSFLNNGKLDTGQPSSPRLLHKRGAFVTLKKKDSLRGCIGFVEPVAPLYQTIIQAAIYAAVKDTRFQPVDRTELADLEIEISVLTPLQKIDDFKRVLVGKHGLLISRGGRSGLLLPQVPVENNWSRTTFLEQACLKAGLPKNAWKTGADIFIFEALVFHE